MMPKFKVGDIVKVVYKKNSEAYRILAVEPYTYLDGTSTFDYCIAPNTWGLEHLLEFYFEEDNVQK